jgi:hypothetical protein
LKALNLRLACQKDSSLPLPPAICERVAGFPTFSSTLSSGASKKKERKQKEGANRKKAQTEIVKSNFLNSTYKKNH